MDRRFFPGNSAPFWWLAALALVSWIAYALIAYLSARFHYDTPGQGHPILAVLILLATAFACYLFAIRVAAGAGDRRQSVWLACGAALLFRLTLLTSVPIQEIDIYRYLWDGAVTSQGVNPFRYSPEQVLTAWFGEPMPEDLERLVALRDESPTLRTILSRVHFGHLPTIYPPTSQAVFGAATLTTSPDANVSTRLNIMKVWMVGFDLATLYLVIALLKAVGRPPALCLIYGWCPLLMKEVANSGHLDAVAVFLTTLAVYLAVRAMFPGAASGRNQEGVGSLFRSTIHPPGKRFGRKRLPTPAFAPAIGAALVLGLAVGAKIYPAILAPLLLAGLARRTNWRVTAAAALTLTTVTVLVMWPMLSPSRVFMAPSVANVAMAEGDNNVPDTPPQDASVTAQDPSLGLTTFLRQWEMNDFLFLLLIENLKPVTELPTRQVAWFSVVDDSLRTRWVETAGNWFQMEPSRVPFATARGLTALAFLVLAAWLTWRGATAEHVTGWLEAAFLTVAWFWLLCPTQNPWYWTWALPLLPFARSRAWLAVSGLTMLYYLRFYFGYHWPETPVWGTPYAGHEFFDFVVTWVEFGPWFAWLAVDYMLYRCRQTGSGVFFGRRLIHLARAKV